MILALLVIALLNAFNVYCYEQKHEIDQFQRIIIDLNIIDGVKGVPIDYNWYNETPTHLSFTSVPGCPKSIDGLPWIYYGNPASCFLAGQKGPCDDKEVLLINLGSLYGVCGCECLDVLLDQTPGLRYKYCIKRNEFGFGQVYDTKENKCFTNGRSQGPCEGDSVVYQLFNGNTLSCIPLCRPLRDTFNKGECLGPWGSGAFVGNIHTHIECESHQKYSRILRKCIPNLKLTLAQIGK